MSPPRRALQDRLDELRAQLAASPSLPPAERARLDALLADLSAHAEREGDVEDEEPQSLAERLQEAREYLEEAHPKLTHAVGAVAEALSRLGI